jgi:hypothetical protein
MAADPERRLAKCLMDSIAEGRACGHEGCGGERVRGVQLHDGAVHSFRESEVVGIDDEAAFGRRSMHAPSLASGV